MFVKKLKSSYSAEKAIKQWAKVLRISGIVIMLGAVITALALFFSDVETFWWISLIILGGTPVVGAPGFIISELMWGFAEVVGNSNKLVRGATDQSSVLESELPEL